MLFADGLVDILEILGFKDGFKYEYHAQDQKLENFSKSISIFNKKMKKIDYFVIVWFSEVNLLNFREKIIILINTVWLTDWYNGKYKNHRNSHIYMSKGICK